MVWAYLIFQALALFGLFMWWHWWSGRTTIWLHGRKRGWSCFLYLIVFSFFQGIALGVVALPGAEETPPVDSAALRLVTVALMFLGPPISLLFTVLWAPRFILPGWIRERLAAGDPVRTAQPAPEVQHLMTKPQNAPTPEPTVEQLQLPTQVKVGVGRWWFGAVVCAVCAVVFVGAGLGGRIGPEALLYLPLAVAAVVGAVFFGRSALRPDHLNFTTTGIEARSWSLAWEEITGVQVSGDPGSHKGHVSLLVSSSAHERIGDKPWSGSSAHPTPPGRPDEYRIELQPGTQAPPAQIADLVTSVLSSRRED